MKRVCLIIIDGFGIGKTDDKSNATLNAKNIEIFKNEYIYFEAYAHGEYVGLPKDVMGNSEAGHLTIGAGRIVKQSLVRINEACENGKLAMRINEIRDYFNGKIHLIGLVSDGSVHSHISHLKYLQTVINEKIYIHGIADGRDTGAKEFYKFYKEIEGVVSISGRFYAMDRDDNYERTKESFLMMTEGSVDKEFDIEKIYDNGITDEFIKPVLIDEDGRIEKNDTLIFFNYRSDRMKQMVRVFKDYKNKFSMTDYKIEGCRPIFGLVDIRNTLSEWLSKNKIDHVHIAETEKYAHVTYFFNGENNNENEFEERILVPSPKTASFEDIPETSMELVKNSCIKAIEENKKFVLANFAGPDLVGHTGNYEKTVISVKKMDQCIQEIYLKCILNNYTLIITSDHGNSEQMIDNGEILKKHTANKVPLIIINTKLIATNNGVKCLSDIAPTICKLFKINIPEEMTGKSFLE